VRDQSTGQPLSNAIVHVKNVTRITKGLRRNDDINHDITSGFVIEQKIVLTYIEAIIFVK